MWSICATSSTWFLMNSGQIVLVARQGIIYSPNGDKLAESKLKDYAQQQLGVPDEVVRVNEPSPELFEQFKAIMAKLPPLQNPPPRRQPRPAPNKAVLVAPPADPPAPQAKEVAKKVTVRERENERPLTVREAEERSQRDDDMKARLIAIAEDNNYEFVDTRRQLLIIGFDDRGQTAKAVFERGRITGYVDYDTTKNGIRTKARNTWFAHKLMGMMDMSTSQSENTK